ncbi:DsbA family protein [Lysinibacter cavernae]|uniref:Protein-disulfide isomerase n=1 Tax=Lysinibacter cavernae TaxID=1640652 RepID=A0A7X5TUM6_9MICO|nr:thioredoxin domain-containing protein [Lysinibacter cavernae]NIH53737.1 protein-disulfide isomerase [Lysinibacter cavernae]
MKKQTRIISLSVAGAAILAGVLIVAGLPSSDPAPTPQATGTASSAPEANEEQTGPSLSTLARRIPGDVAAIGDVDAPVVMIEFADYRCPFCAVFARETMPPLIKEYVDSGQMRIEWRDLPLFGDQSIAAAVAVRAAGEQGRFWEYHGALYGGAPDRGHPDYPQSRLIEIAEEAGVPDIEKFTSDLAREDLIDLVYADYSEGTSLGITSAPLFTINETAIAGAQPLSTFREIIESELAKVQ